VVVRRRRQRQRQLWQFLLEILCDEQHTDIISWVRRDDGVFRFVKPKSVAELWGRRQRRSYIRPYITVDQKHNIANRKHDHGAFILANGAFSIIQIYLTQQKWRLSINKDRW